MAEDVLQSELRARKGAGSRGITTNGKRSYVGRLVAIGSITMPANMPAVRLYMTRSMLTPNSSRTSGTSKLTVKVPGF